jgi:hypothetical protein
VLTNRSSHILQGGGKSAVGGPLHSAVPVLIQNRQHPLPDLVTEFPEIVHVFGRRPPRSRTRRSRSGRANGSARRMAKIPGPHRIRYSRMPPNRQICGQHYKVAALSGW